MENVFLPPVDDADDVEVEPPAIAVGGAGAVFLLDHMSSEPDKNASGVMIMM